MIRITFNLDKNIISSFEVLLLYYIIIKVFEIF